MSKVYRMVYRMYANMVCVCVFSCVNNFQKNHAYIWVMKFLDKNLIKTLRASNWPRLRALQVLGLEQIWKEGSVYNTTLWIFISVKK